MDFYTEIYREDNLDPQSILHIKNFRKNSFKKKKSNNKQKKPSCFLDRQVELEITTWHVVPAMIRNRQTFRDSNLKGGLFSEKHSDKAARFYSWHAN